MGISLIVNIGCDLASSQASLDLADRYPEIWATVGFHPHNADRLREDDLELLADLSRHPRVVAIGEIGLDFYRNLSPREAQLEAFRRQLELTGEVERPVVIHCRRAHEEVLKLLTQSSPATEPPGVIHCFSGDVALARRYLELGFFISFTGQVTYPLSPDMTDLLHYLPSDRLLVETDSPFLTPRPYRGRRNEPAYLPAIIEAIARVRGTTTDSLVEVTVQNALRLFRLADGKERSPVAN